MKQLLKKALYITAGAVLATALLPVRAHADTSASATVNVTATVAPKISITVDDSSADFGTTLDPVGTAGSSETAVVTDPTQGAYYIWKSSVGTGATVTVKSNKAWSGTIAASENIGTSTSLTIASGALRYSTTQPGTFSDAAAATAFVVSPGPKSWQSGHDKGTATFPFFYALRVLWSDDPGTFSSTVTYTATQD